MASLVRVAAYNKDDLISNSWLFIAGEKAGRATGRQLSATRIYLICKNQFTVAVVGASATVLGTGIALASSEQANTGALIATIQIIAKISPAIVKIIWKD